MAGRRRVGAHAAPRHARRRSMRGIRGLALLVAGGITALTAGILLAGSPAGAEAGTATGTLTLLGIRDSNCDFQTGGTTVYVKPGGAVTFKGELTGVSIKVPVLGTIPITSSAISSFNYRLVIDKDAKHPHLVNGKTTYKLSNVRRNHELAWSANSIQVTVPILGSISVPLHGNLGGVPAGGKLDWVGKVVASSNTKCGIAEVPGGGVSVGPIHLSVPPITSLPSQPGLPSIPGLPGGGSSSSGHHHPRGGGSSSPGSGGGTDTSLSPRPTTIPELVVPNAGSGGDSAFGGGGVGGLGALPDGGIGPIAPGAVTSTASAPGPAASSSKAKPVDLATDSSDNGLGGAQLPVLLAIVAIIALSLVTATYARMYLLRKPPAA